MLGLKEMIEAAMREKAPAMYRDLQQSGSLEAEILQRVSLYHQVFDETLMEQQQPVNKRMAAGEFKTDPMAQVQAFAQASRTARELALELVLEFEPEGDRPDDPSEIASARPMRPPAAPTT